VTQIVSGGAGAPLRTKHWSAAKQNPHSAAYASTHHYCLFEVAGETCRMRAITPAGKVLDTKTWRARKAD
jgi:hypothetical protein